MKTLYLDMDGVVADFDKYAMGVTGSNKKTHMWPDSIWKKLVQGHQRMYRDLEKMPQADDLVRMCTNLCASRGWNILFLTAIPKDNDMPWAFADKMEWAKKYYPNIPVHFGPYSHDKWHHCKHGDILIDDRESNIDEWNTAGGVGILYTNLHSALMKLLQF